MYTNSKENKSNILKKKTLKKLREFCTGSLQKSIILSVVLTEELIFVQNVTRYTRNAESMFDDKIIFFVVKEKVFLFVFGTWIRLLVIL